MRLATLLARSDALHSALDEAIGPLDNVPMVPRATVTMDALIVASQHGQAIRLLLSSDLQVSAMGLLRLQYEAVLRAAWACYAASERDVAALAAPLTPSTAKAANSIGLPAHLLESIEACGAPADLKRMLREIRTSSWGFMNSYVHAALHPLRRHDAHPEHELVTALRISNGMGAVTCALMVLVMQRPHLQNDINVVCIGFPECMPPRHLPS